MRPGSRILAKREAQGWAELLRGTGNLGSWTGDLWGSNSFSAALHQEMLPGTCWYPWHPPVFEMLAQREFVVKLRIQSRPGEQPLP